MKTLTEYNIVMLQKRLPWPLKINADDLPYSNIAKANIVLRQTIATFLPGMSHEESLNNLKLMLDIGVEYKEFDRENADRMYNCLNGLLNYM